MYHVWSLRVQAVFRRGYRDDEGCTQAITRWAANAKRDAHVVAFVKDTDDVALALKYARTNKPHVAIRCGSSSPSGASSGPLIDLSRLLYMLKYTTASCSPSPRMLPPFSALTAPWPGER